MKPNTMTATIVIRTMSPPPNRCRLMKAAIAKTNRTAVAKRLICGGLRSRSAQKSFTSQLSGDSGGVGGPAFVVPFLL